MSGGHNHYSECPCPWCYHRRKKRASEEVATPINFRQAGRGSYTIPNARCSECSAPVFFYRSPHGGSVYFDELGIPWPKHPCLDSGRPPKRNKLTPLLSPPSKEPECQKDGWFPIVFEILGSPNSEGLQSLWVKNILNGTSGRWQTSKMPITIKDEPVFAKLNPQKKWDIDTPSGKYVAWNFPIDPNQKTWRDRLKPQTTRSKTLGKET